MEIWLGIHALPADTVTASASEQRTAVTFILEVGGGGGGGEKREMRGMEREKGGGRRGGCSDSRG